MCFVGFLLLLMPLPVLELRLLANRSTGKVLKWLLEASGDPAAVADVAPADAAVAALLGQESWLSHNFQV